MRILWFIALAIAVMSAGCGKVDSPTSSKEVPVSKDSVGWGHTVEWPQGDSITVSEPRLFEKDGQVDSNWIRVEVAIRNNSNEPDHAANHRYEIRSEGRNVESFVPAKDGLQLPSRMIDPHEVIEFTLTFASAAVGQDLEILWFSNDPDRWPVTTFAGQIHV